MSVVELNSEGKGEKNEHRKTHNPIKMSMNIIYYIPHLKKNIRSAYKGLASAPILTKKSLSRSSSLLLKQKLGQRHYLPTVAMGLISRIQNT